MRFGCGDFVSVWLMLCGLRAGRETAGFVTLSYVEWGCEPEEVGGEIGEGIHRVGRGD